MMMTNDQMVMMKRLQVCGFVLLETQLFLDTHPADREALDYYQKYARMYQETMDAYTKQYGPVSLPTDMDMQTWKWVDEPWPWENMEG